MKELKRALEIWKKIALTFGGIAALCLPVIIYLVGTYVWMTTNPFTYNDYADTHEWLPKVAEPTLTMHRYDGVKPSDEMIDTRDKNQYIVYDEERNCWDFSGGCALDHIQVRNATNYTWAVFISGNPEIELMGACPVKEIREDGTLYSMGPECYFVLFPPTDGSNVIFIAYK